MNRGWVKLYRKLSDNKLWTSEPFTRGQAWVDLLLIANHKDSFIYIRGNRVDILRGQVGWSQLKLAERWKWSRGKVKRFINELEIDHQIVQQNNHLSSLLTIINYNQYQSNDTADSTADGTTDGQQTVQQTDTNKNDKKEKNAKKEDKPVPQKRFVKPSLEEVKAYCKERKNSIDPETFIAHYTSNGWKVGKNQTPMKCWKSAVITWEKRDKTTPQASEVADMTKKEIRRYQESINRIRSDLDYIEQLPEDELTDTLRAESERYRADIARDESEIRKLEG